MKNLALSKSVSTASPMLPRTLRSNVREGTQALEKARAEVASGWQSLGIAVDGFLGNVESGRRA